MRRAVIAAVLVASATVEASPSQDLERARSSFRMKDWQSAIPVLKDLLYPRVKLADQEEAIAARVLLGAAHFELGDRDAAIEEFEKALQLDPERTITTLSFSADAVRQFESVKQEQKARLERDAERKRLAEAAERLEQYRKSLVVYQERPFWFNFLPFGLAQYTQGRVGSSLLFAGLQAPMFAANVGIYIYLVRTYGFTSTSVPITDGPRVRRLQQIQIGTGVAFIGFYAWGLFDAIRHHKPRQLVQGDDSLIPPELLPQKPPPKTSFRDRLRLGPMFMDDSVGIGIGWEN